MKLRGFGLKWKSRFLLRIPENRVMILGNILNPGLPMSFMYIIFFRF